MYYGRFLYMDTPMADTPIPRHFGNCQKIHLRWGVLSDNSDIRISRTRYSCLTTNYSTISPFISFIIYYLLYIIYTPPSSQPISSLPHQLISPLLNISSIYSFPIPYTTIIYTTPLSFPYTFPYTFNLPYPTALFINTSAPCPPQLFQSPLTATPIFS